jgi:hypothetical protein
MEFIINNIDKVFATASLFKGKHQENQLSINWTNNKQ